MVQAVSGENGVCLSKGFVLCKPGAGLSPLAGRLGLDLHRDSLCWAAFARADGGGWAFAHQWFFLPEPAASPHRNPEQGFMAESQGTSQSCVSTPHSTPTNHAEDTSFL